MVSIKGYLCHGTLEKAAHSRHRAATRETLRAHRRHQILQLWLTKTMTQADIGLELGLSRVVVNKTIKAAEREWMAMDLTAREELTRREVAKLDALEAMALLQDGEVEDVVEFRLMDTTDRARILLEVAKRRAKLLGLDAAVRVELTGKDGKPLVERVHELTDAELAEIVAGAQQGAAA